MVESTLPNGEFIPNDITLGVQPVSNDAGAAETTQDGAVTFALITGPNMAGKSTYLRQIALITIMAQMGSFVPAEYAAVGIVDKIFCRVGAEDNLAGGESTFLVEMNESAYILNNATDKSLVIMDEIGRGTGTKDGLALAAAIARDMLERIKCRTLFATHYNELTKIINPELKNLSMAVDEKDGKIIFRRLVQKGPAAASYGIHVARIAGLPGNVIETAQNILFQLQQNDALLPQLKNIFTFDDAATAAVAPTAVNSSGKRPKAEHKQTDEPDAADGEPGLF